MQVKVDFTAYAIRITRIRVVKVSLFCKTIWTCVWELMLIVFSQDTFVCPVSIHIFQCVAKIGVKVGKSLTRDISLTIGVWVTHIKDSVLNLGIICIINSFHFFLSCWWNHCVLWTRWNINWLVFEVADIINLTSIRLLLKPSGVIRDRVIVDEVQWHKRTLVHASSFNNGRVHHGNLCREVWTRWSSWKGYKIRIRTHWWQIILLSKITHS